MFSGDFADKSSTISKKVVVSSRGATETVKLGNVNSNGGIMPGFRIDIVATYLSFT
jgi:hypothetical protein